MKKEGNTHATLPNSSLGTSLPAPVSASLARKAATRAAISSFGNLRSHTNETLIIIIELDHLRTRLLHSVTYTRTQ